jgi:hypothetical protein
MEPIKIYYTVLKKIASDHGNDYTVQESNFKFVYLNEIMKEATELSLYSDDREKMILDMINYWNKHQIKNSYNLWVYSQHEISDDDLMAFLDFNNY